MGSEHTVSVCYGDKGHEYSSLETFLQHFPSRKWSNQEVLEVKKYITSLCCAISLEWNEGYILEDENGYYLTIYLKKFIHEDKEHRLYFRPIYGVKMYFRGLEIVRIYAVEFSNGGAKK